MVAVAVGTSLDARRYFRGALQLVAWTLAIARLIERIRLADIRMATPPEVGKGLGFGLSVCGLEFGEQETRLLHQAEEVVLRERPVKLL